MNSPKTLSLVFFCIACLAAPAADGIAQETKKVLTSRATLPAPVEPADLSEPARAAEPAAMPGMAAPAAGPFQEGSTTQSSKASTGLPSGGAPKTSSFVPSQGLPLSSAAQESPEKKALDKLTVENQIFQAELAKQLHKLTKEKEELRAQTDLLSEKMRLELAKLENEQKLDTAKIEGKYRLKIAEVEAEHKRMSADNALLEEQFRTRMAKLRQEKEQLKTDNEVKDEQLRAKDQANDVRRKDIDMEMREMDLKTKRLKTEEDGLRNTVEKLRIEVDKLRTEDDTLKTELEMRSKKAEWKSQANKEPDYLKNPFDKGILTVTDRRISLNGPIMTGVADYVTDRIDYYNNKSSELPIFIVIDRSPGGSVMEGYRIVKAMEASKAPVHVIVKSYAASMAAVITTLAKESYAYPNAVILHHQMSTMQWGNMTQLKEQLDIAKEWYRRLADPVSKKMGMTLDEFTKTMYSHNSDGDWEEFGDKAVTLKWVNTIVHEIRETGTLTDPEKAEKAGPPNKLEEKVDEKGQRYVSLPRLDPFDLYWIYNPDKYYR
ncbi:MAG: ATP-dependent Clp protease proteolytic subunit [Elusimicrobiota bacterium]